MSIWFTHVSPEFLNHGSQNTMVSHLGIEILEVGDDSLRGRMPVDARTIQPAGLLHGGASATLAETLASAGANPCVDPTQKLCVGLEINVNHIRSMRSGWVYGVARPLHIGGATQVWEIRISDEQDRLIAISRLTLAVLDISQKLTNWRAT
jgi:1,4-dihydroxy-2-naphthoyl-CoA hydrolase